MLYQLTPNYGKHIQAIAEKLTEKSMVDSIITDLHHIHHFEALENASKQTFYPYNRL